MNNFDRQYLEVMNRILKTGIDRPDRTSVGTSRAIWGAMLDHDMSEGFPIVTTRKTTFRIAFEETWWMLRGETDTKKLEEKNINIWVDNTTREFLDGRNLKYLPEGHMGKGYGFQWRHFGGHYAMKPQDEIANGQPIYLDQMLDYTKNQGGYDQLWMLLHNLKHNPNDRRHIMVAWNPAQTHEMALPPCHLYQQYQVLDGKLNSSFVMRSHDWLYGGPFNFMGYALLNTVFAKYAGLEPGHLTYFGNDVHIYENQLEIAEKQVLRDPYPLPRIELVKDVKTMDDILNLQHEDFILHGYKAHPDFKNKPKMAQ